MRLLLDTHSFLWFIAGDAKLSSVAREAMEDIENEAFLSTASLWEMAIEASLGKLELARPFGQLIPEQMERNHVVSLPITVPHLEALMDLPFHHRDPFDRLIIAQAKVEGFTIASRDPVFPQYDVDVLW